MARWIVLITARWCRSTNSRNASASPSRTRNMSATSESLGVITRNATALSETPQCHGSFTCRRSCKSHQAAAEPVETWSVVMIVIERHRHQRRPAHDTVARHESEIARIETVVAVVAHHEVTSGRNFNRAARPHRSYLRLNPQGMRLPSDGFIENQCRRNVVVNQRIGRHLAVDDKVIIP